jgi:ABC-type uncharacterized transport system substrate-binding protein
MSILLVGGHERMSDEYKKIGFRFGHKMKVFTQMPAQFGKCIGEPDAIILFTSTASHKMVRAAIQEAKKKKIPLLRSHTSSGNSLEGLFRTLR